MLRSLAYVLLLSVCVRADQSSVLTFALMTSFGQHGINTSGIVPAVDLALRDINNRTDLLLGYRLAYDSVRDSQCQQDRSLDMFFQAVQSAPVKLGVIGCGCSVATEPVAAISHHWNISQISYFSESAALSDRSRCKKYFRTNPSGLVEYPAFYSIMNHFNWKQIAILTQNEDLFTKAEINIRSNLSPNFTVKSSTFYTDSDPWIAVQELFTQGFRVFFLNCYSGLAKRIICQASKQGYKYPHYAWILQDWYIDRWWMETTDHNNVNCSDYELEMFLDKALSIRIHPSPEEYFDLSVAGINFQTEYVSRAKENGYMLSDAGGRAYDAVWILALALNHTASMVKNGDINGTGCENTSGSLVPLEQFQYSNEKMGCLIQWNIQRTNISGVSGPIVFDQNGTRIVNLIHLLQYVHHGPGNLSRTKFAYFLTQDAYTFHFLKDFNDSCIYPDGIPPDGMPVELVITYSIPLVITIDSLSALGLVFALTCCLFNLTFRKKRVVKLSSGTLNYLIILGAVLMYFSVFLYVTPTTIFSIVEPVCVLKQWMFITGYGLCFGTVLAKMWRIYYIFQSAKNKKTVIKDWHMLLVVATMVGIGLILLTVGTSVPSLRGTAKMELNQENPSDTAAGGVQVNFKHLICYSVSSSSFYWNILILAYLAVFQIVGIVLAFETRKVKFPGLRDSAFVATIIYISSLVLVLLAVDTFILSTYLNVYGAIFAIGILILTTVFLLFTFVPKMVLLYRGSDTEISSFSVGVGPQNSYDLEAKVASLEKILQEKEKVIVLFENEISALKEKREGMMLPYSE